MRGSSPISRRDGIEPRVENRFKPRSLPAVPLSLAGSWVAARLDPDELEDLDIRGSPSTSSTGGAGGRESDGAVLEALSIGGYRLEGVGKAPIVG